MWFYGSVDIPRQTLFELKSVKKNASWLTSSSPYGAALQVNPYAFAYAAMRTSIVGKNIGLRGSIAGCGLAITATSYLTRTGSTLEFHHRFNDVKDFIGTGVKGTVGAAFAYLYMLNNGYAWSGHWEDVVTSMPSGPHPDFVFASPSDVCLLDAKGSASAQSKVEDTVKSEWKRQIWPHRGTKLHFGGTCTEGTVIATAVAPKASARFVKAHGRFPKGTIPPTASAASVASAIKSVQRANYINACFLLGLRRTAFALMATRRSDSSPREVLALEVQSRDSSDGVIFGPPRLLIDNGEVTRVMRPFGQISVLEEMTFLLHQDMPTKMIGLTEPLLAPEETSERATLIVQGRDGIGAHFSPVI